MITVWQLVRAPELWPPPAYERQPGEGREEQRQRGWKSDRHDGREPARKDSHLRFPAFPAGFPRLVLSAHNIVLTGD